MKRIKTYKLFESVEISDYITLSELLYDLFDEWGIAEWTNETFQEFVNPRHKFWTFRDTLKIKQGDGFIKKNQINKKSQSRKPYLDIYIFNIRISESYEFYSDLKQALDNAKNVIGKDLTIHSDVIYGDDNKEEFIDYKILIK